MIGVIYPDIAEPFRSVFQQIVDGIEDKAKNRVVAYAVTSNTSAQTLGDDLRRQGIRQVIALGRNGLKVASGLGDDITVLAAGVINVPDVTPRTTAVHSLAPDPSVLFEKLKTMMPGFKRVFTVYDPQQNAWLVHLAQEAAKAQGIEFKAHEASDIKSAVRLYQDFFNNADPKKDVLWLPQDSTTVEESSVLPMILLESWNRGVAVISSNVGHVRRGALLALYPNNFELGRTLANAALNPQTGAAPPPRSKVPLKDVLVAVNIRTASHLGLDIGYKQQIYDMVFPEQ